MSNILREIFFGRYDPLVDASPEREECNQLLVRMGELEDQLEEELAEEQWEGVYRYILLLRRLEDMCYADYFAEGFRLGVELYRRVTPSWDGLSGRGT